MALPCKGRCIFDAAGWRIVGSEVYAHEVFGRHALVTQIIILFETEATIIGWITENHASGGTSGAKLLKTRADQGRTNACSLMIGFDRYRS